MHRLGEDLQGPGRSVELECRVRNKRARQCQRQVSSLEPSPRDFGNPSVENGPGDKMLGAGGGCTSGSEQCLMVGRS